MTPPGHQAAIDAPTAGVSSRARLSLRPGDAVLAADLLALVALFWLAKIVFNLDNSMAVFAVATFALIVSPHSHRSRLSAAGLDDAGHIVRGVAIAYVAASAASAITSESMEDMQVLVFVAAATVPVLLTARSMAYSVERRMRRNGAKDRVLLVGGGDVASRIVRILDEHEEYGLNVVGALDDGARYSAEELGTPLLGSPSDLASVLRERDVDAVIVAFADTEDPELVESIREARAAGATVWVVPRLYELGAQVSGAENLWGLPLIRLTPVPTQRGQWAFKRAFDIVVSSFALLLSSPLLALVALGVAIESGRPVLFRQERIGKDGKPFDILKFRSMKQVSVDRQQTEWCGDAEARVTRIGRVIRALGIDELPQLFNILRGDMSLVGPRPERPHFVAEFSDVYRGYNARHRLPVGLTGMSQVNGLRGDTSIEDRTVFDNYYIENWSLAQDLKIMLRTAKTFIQR